MQVRMARNSALTNFAIIEPNDDNSNNQQQQPVLGDIDEQNATARSMKRGSDHLKDLFKTKN
jgi:hypothetical protein